ncbi:unnamed protein product [Protopolystoma xenopodis]|uniref:Gamma tubulin complex component C-terminal domain-containing protein n=1 Tax=Protopolystoma xenopodis TaxID=117903 RepID=A0A3S5BBA5_9PLAT|nr:unnamed protein product [Protopolystoma xenopodis]
MITSELDPTTVSLGSALFDSSELTFHPSILEHFLTTALEEAGHTQHHNLIESKQMPPSISWPYQLFALPFTIHIITPTATSFTNRTSAFGLGWHQLARIGLSVGLPEALTGILPGFVNWPSTDPIASAYQKIFTLLLKVKYTGWLVARLHSQFYRHIGQSRSLTYIHDPLDQTRQMRRHQAELWLHEAGQVVRGLDGYLANQVVLASWSEFRTRLDEGLCRAELLEPLDRGAKIISGIGAPSWSGVPETTNCFFGNRSYADLSQVTCLRDIYQLHSDYLGKVLTR